MPEQLVVPRPYVSKVIFMAHSHLLGAHMGMDKTRDRILDRFYWPRGKKGRSAVLPSMPRMSADGSETLSFPCQSLKYRSTG